MSPRFAEIAFTSSVKAAQLHYGTRHNNERYEQSGDRRDVLTPREVEFLEQSDSFYQATVADNGWPYVQHRGGPRGFLRVLDERTIGFADFRGNLQYISVGNLGADDRISMILMDYPNQRRLKILGRARVVDEAQDPQLVASLKV
ncbi:MAG: pyridoxamine 5'-phosphate oxidase family protein, partial [Byssovorax sp.]